MATHAKSDPAEIKAKLVDGLRVLADEIENSDREIGMFNISRNRHPREWVTTIEISAMATEAEFIDYTKATGQWNDH